MTNKSISKPTSNHGIKNITEIALSIIFAGAIAHTLYSLAIYVPENNTAAWAFCSFALIIITIVIIAYVLGTKPEKDDSTNIFKIAIITFSTMTAFSLSRFFYFMSQKGLNYTHVGNYFAILIFLIVCGVTFIVQGYKEGCKTSFYITGGALIIFAIAFYFLTDLLGIGVIT